MMNPTSKYRIDPPVLLISESPPRKTFQGK